MVARAAAAYVMMSEAVASSPVSTDMSKQDMRNDQDNDKYILTARLSHWVIHGNI